MIRCFYHKAETVSFFLLAWCRYAFTCMGGHIRLINGSPYINCTSHSVSHAADSTVLWNLTFSSSIYLTCSPLRRLWLRLWACEMYKWLSRRRRPIPLWYKLRFAVSSVTVIRLVSFSFLLNLLVPVFNGVICGIICFAPTSRSY
jgi:hypothetical protein